MSRKQKPPQPRSASTPSSGGANPPSVDVDVGALLDEGRWSLYQKLLVVATALAIVLDGLDNQVIAAAVPALMSEWDLPRAAFAPLLASGLIGMMVGGALAGFLGDRFGRRVALIGSVLWFGVLTALASRADQISALSAFRFLAGLGLGGSIPNAAALSSEYVPKRQRAFAVTLTIACVPLGGTLAGLIGAVILPRYGWRPLFLISGVLPLVLAAVLWKILPESPRYLARHKKRWPELVALLRRLGNEVPKDAAFVDTTEGAVRASARELLVPELRRDTLALCGCFFFCLLSVYVVVNWVPSALTGAGFDVGAASYGLTAFNVGGFLGAILGAAVIGRLGSRLTMLTMAAAAILGAAALAAFTTGAPSTFAILALLAWSGGFINAVQTTMYALAAHVYPTGIRATGVGGAVAFGRIGGVLSTYVGSWALESGGASRLFALLAATMALVLVALALVRRHIPRGSAVQAAAAH